MRDIHGRYQSLKDIASNGPSFARGCPSCACGITLAPELTGAAPLYLERLVQAIDGDIIFCTCQAGQRYRVSLLNRRQEIIERHKRDADMKPQHKIAGSKETLNPENTLRVDSPIDIARDAIHAAQAKRVPTVHAAEERIPA